MTAEARPDRDLMVKNGSVVPVVVLLVVAGGVAGCTRHHVSSAAGPEVVVLDDRPLRHGHHLWWVAGDSVYRGEAGPDPLHARRVYRRPGATLGSIAVTGPDQAVVVDDRLIVRVPPVPGPAAIPVTVLAHPVRGDLRTDGTSLFWADDLGVRSVPITGGTARTVAAVAGVQDIAVRGGGVFFAVGRAVRSTPAGGGPIRTVVSTNNNVTSICAAAGLHWIELGVEAHTRAGRQWLAPPAVGADNLSRYERTHAETPPGLGGEGRGPYRFVDDGAGCDIARSG